MKIYKVTYKKNNNVVNKEFTKKREANKYYIDMLLDGVQNLTFEEVKPQQKKENLNSFFVRKQIRQWRYVKDLECFCWVTIYDEQITPSRKNMILANKDFANLGFSISDTATVQCYDDITPQVVWVRYIVQQRTIK